MRPDGKLVFTQSNVDALINLKKYDEVHITTPSRNAQLALLNTLSEAMGESRDITPIASPACHLLDMQSRVVYVVYFDVFVTCRLALDGSTNTGFYNCDSNGIVKFTGKICQR